MLSLGRIVQVMAEAIGILLGLLLVAMALVGGLVAYAVRGDREMREQERKSYEDYYH
jgi:uncharacterized oligopeptide transporter (OPT) family protein